MSGAKKSKKVLSGEVPSKSLKAQPAIKPFLSAEFVQDTSDEDSENSPSRSERSPTPIIKKLAPARKAQAEATVATAKPKPTRRTESNSKKPKLKSRSPSPSSTDSGASRSDEDDRSGTGSGSEDETEDSSESIAEAPNRQKPKVQQPPSAAPARTPYRPPPGFETVPIFPSTPPELADLFSPSHLQGKQLWHITVPNGVPIDSIKEVASKSVQNGKSVLSHEGSDYGLVPEVEGRNAKDTLLLPYSKSNDYRDANITITKTLHLQQLARLPSLSYRSRGLSNGITKAPVTYKKTVRQQPEGLRMRYRPFGDSESSSSDSSDEAPQFRVPPVIQAQQQVEERSSNNANNKNHNHRESPSRSSANLLETPKPSKKRNHEIAHRWEDDYPSSAATLKKRKTKKASSEGSSHHQQIETSNQSRPQPAASSSSESTMVAKHSPSKTSLAVQGIPKNPEQPQDEPDTPPTIKQNHPIETKEQNAKRKEVKTLQNQTEKKSSKSTPKTRKPETPSTTPLPIPRTNEEKRQRKTEKRRRQEARQSAIKDKENDPKISSCEQKSAPLNAENKPAKLPKKEQTKLKQEKPQQRDALMDAAQGMEYGYSSATESEREQWGGSLEDDMEAYMNGDYHLIGGICRDF